MLAFMQGFTAFRAISKHIVSKTLQFKYFIQKGKNFAGVPVNQAHDRGCR